MQRSPNQRGPRWRVTMIYIGMAVLFFGAIGRVFAISVIDHDQYAERSRRNSMTTIPILAERGRIFSADGQVLAQSIFSGTSIFINARAVPHESRYEVAKTLADVLGLDTTAIYNKLTQHANNAGLPIGHFLDDQAGAKIRRLIDAGKLPGVHFRDRVERRYPKGESAGQVLGFVNLTGAGSGGIEGPYDAYLRGTDGYQEMAVDARKHSINAVDDDFVAAQNGADVFTTLDSTIQEFTEDAVRRCAEQWEPEAIMAVVMETKTGRILAMANYPSFDPAHYYDVDQESMKNRALTDAWEPGSILKPLLYSAAIEEGIFDKNTVVPLAMRTRVAFRTISDDWPVHGNLRVNPDGSPNPKGNHIPLFVGLGKSLNVIATYVGESLYAGKRYPELKYSQDFVDPYEGNGRIAKWIKRYGFGAYSGIDIGGGRRESRGVIPSNEQWDPNRGGGHPKPYAEIVPTLAMGYGIQVTGIQMLNNFNVIANDGKRMRPYLVERVTSRDGEVLLERKPEEIADTGLSQSTTAQIREILEWVVDNGTGRNAKLDDYRIGGKTGTALMLDPVGDDPKAKRTWSDWKRRCSFISIGPIERPELTILFSVQAPSKSPKETRRGKDFSGGTVAAPYLAEIMQRSLQHRGVAPSKAKDDSKE